MSNQKVHYNYQRACEWWETMFELQGKEDQDRHRELKQERRSEIFKKVNQGNPSH